MPRTLTSPQTGTPVWYFAAAPPAAAPMAAVITASLAGRPVSVATTGIAWAGGVATVTLASAVSDPPGSIYPITVAGVTPAGYNGSYTGTITGPTTVTYPLASNPGAVTVQGTVAYASGFDATGQNVPFYNCVSIDPSAGTITARNGIGFYYGQRPASGAWITMPRVNEPIAGAWPTNQEALAFAEHDLSPAQKMVAQEQRLVAAEAQAAGNGNGNPGTHAEEDPDPDPPHTVTRTRTTTRTTHR